MNFCYWLGTTRLYSASRVIRDLGLKPDYGGADPTVIHRAACRGKLTESYCYPLIRGVPVTVRSRHCGSLQPDVSARVRACFRWMERYQPRFADAQGIVFSAEHRIAWQRDLRVWIDGTLWLVDIKCTSKAEKDWPLQLGCGLSYDEDGCNNAAILHLNPKLNKDGFRWINKWSGTQLKSWWAKAVTHWHSRYQFNQLKADLGFDAEAIGLEIEDDSDI